VNRSTFSCTQIRHFLVGQRRSLAPDIPRWFRWHQVCHDCTQRDAQSACAILAHTECRLPNQL